MISLRNAVENLEKDMQKAFIDSRTASSFLGRMSLLIDQAIERLNEMEQEVKKW